MTTEEPPETASASVRKDALLSHIAESNSMFETSILRPLGSSLKDRADLRAYVASQPSESTNQPAEHVLQMIDKVTSTIWNTQVQATKYKRRLRAQARRVSLRLTIKTKEERAKRKNCKSEKRKAAGKLKASCLAQWRQDCSNARTALKERGYEGSLKLHKGSPLYREIQLIQQTRFLSMGAAAATSVSEAPVADALAAAAVAPVVRRRLRKRPAVRI